MMDHRPLSPWAYFGLQILYGIPVIGLIFLIVHSINGAGNINRRNFARSYWCVLVLVGALIALAFVFRLVPVALQYLQPAL